MKKQPKKHIVNVNLKNKVSGYAQRLSYANTITKKAPVIPKSLEYEDIDMAFKNFIDDKIAISIDGLKIPTFTLFSGQRFSEYSQTWEHSDADGNLLMNFKTISREPNPNTGKNQGGLWNIPGDRYYTLLTRTVLDDSGRELYEIYSMKQPCAVDMTYRVSFVTNIYENLNRFNAIINDLFKSRQCYIRANGHYLPMTIEEINDETQYGIDDRKFFTQSITIKLMAYIIHPDDFKVERKPKTATMFYEGDKLKSIKPEITIDEIEDETNLSFGTIDLTVRFESWHDKVEFNIDTDMIVEDISASNIRSYRIFVNGDMIYTKKGFSLKEDDNVRIKILPFDNSESVVIKLTGYNPNKTYRKDIVPEFVSDDVVKHEQIFVE